MCISVVVPVYKAEAYIERCVESLLMCRCEDIEIILVDDGSPDCSPQLCDYYASQYDNIRVIHKQNGGVTSARSAGVNAATGEYICFVDSDDSVEATYFAQFLKAIKEYAPDMILCDYTEIALGKRIERHQPVPTGVYDRERIVQDIHPYMLSAMPFYTFGVTPTVWTKCIKKARILPVLNSLPNLITFGEDVAITCACLLDAQSICVINSTAYLYQDNPNSVTRTYNSKLVYALCSLYEYLQKLATEKKWEYHSQMQQYIIMLTYIVVCNELSCQKMLHLKESVSLQEYLHHPMVQSAVKESQHEDCYPLRYRFMIRCLKSESYSFLEHFTRLDLAKNKYINFFKRLRKV